MRHVIIKITKSVIGSDGGRGDRTDMNAINQQLHTFRIDRNLRRRLRRKQKPRWCTDA